MKIWICTDMEGLAGVDREGHFSRRGDMSEYRHGREQLTADLNAATAGCFDAGASEVIALDGHGANRGRGFIREELDPRIKVIGISKESPKRLEGLDESVTGVMMIGQHAMAGTAGAFFPHTQIPGKVEKYSINGVVCGEMGQLAAYAGYFGVPLIYASGDEALCEETWNRFPHAASTPTKKECRLYPAEEVRRRMRADAARAIRKADRRDAFKVEEPVEISVLWADVDSADRIAAVPGVERADDFTTKWFIESALDVFTWPSGDWSPMVKRKRGSSK